MAVTYEERLNGINVRINAIIANQNKAGEITAIVKANNVFFDSCDKLFSNLYSWKLAVKYFDLHLSENDVALLKECFNMAKDNFSCKFVKLAESFKGKVGKVCKDMENAWNEYSLSFESDTIDKLNILKVVATEKKVINDMLVSFDEVKIWPLSESKIQNYLTNKKRAMELFELKRFDSEIEDFLRKVSRHEATFLDLNDTIISWIRKENLERNISINIKASN